MPRTPPTIAAPLPQDFRVLSLAKTTGLSRREAFAAAVESWAWMSVQAVEGIVPRTAVDALDVVADIAGFGQAMLQAGLVGVVGDGLVLPAELRHHERDERGEAAAAAARGDAGEDERRERRKEQNRKSSVTYRKKNRVTGSKAKPSGNAWRSLGYVAGHEVRVFDGQYGVYAMVLGATIGGQQYKKLTVGDKSWSLDTVALADALPGLVEKWKAVDTQERKSFVSKPLEPAYADFRDDAERLTMLAKLAAEGDRHADAADASSRHADASATVSKSSADENAESEQKPFDGRGLDAADASANRHADGVSSMSCLSKSSSHEEEDISREGKAAAEGIDDDANDRQQKYTQLLRRFSQALGQDQETIRSWWKHNRDFLRLKLEQAGINPTTGLRFDADAARKPADARDDIVVTTEPIAGDKPAAGSVDARDDDEPDHRTMTSDERRRQSQRTMMALREQGVPLPTFNATPDVDDSAFEQTSVLDAIAAGHVS